MIEVSRHDCDACSTLPVLSMVLANVSDLGTLMKLEWRHFRLW